MTDDELADENEGDPFTPEQRAASDRLIDQLLNEGSVFICGICDNVVMVEYTETHWASHPGPLRADEDH